MVQPGLVAHQPDGASRASFAAICRRTDQILVAIIVIGAVGYLTIKQDCAGILVADAIRRGVPAADGGLRTIKVARPP